MGNILRINELDYCKLCINDRFISYNDVIYAHDSCGFKNNPKVSPYWNLQYEAYNTLKSNIHDQLYIWIFESRN
jgi:hypothetical protein